MIHISMIPQESVEEYSLSRKLHNGYIYARVTKVMYRTSLAGRISNDTLVKQLDPYGYHPSITIPGIWKHNRQPLKFTLVVHDFGVKYLGKEYTLNLKAQLKKNTR